MISLEKLRKADDFDWTAISPPTSIKPGERTGKYRLGTDAMVVDAADNGRLWREDFAVALWMRSKIPNMSGAGLQSGIGPVRSPR